jgi:hypothetical protein
MITIPQFLKSKILITLVILVVMASIAVRLTVRFTDAEQYRHQLLDEIVKITGKKVSFNGDIFIRTVPILNKVNIEISDVLIADDQGKFLEIKKLLLVTSLTSIINGNLNVHKMQIDSAHLSLDKSKDDISNWRFIYNIPKDSNIFNLEILDINDMNVSYNNEPTFTSVNFQFICFKDFSMDIKGVFDFHDNNISLDGKIGSSGSDNFQDIKINIVRDGIKALLQGKLLNSEQDFKIDADMKADMEKPSFLINILSGIAPVLNALPQPSFKESINIQAKLLVNHKDIEIKNFLLNSTNSNGSGDIKFSLNDDVNLKIDLSFSQLNIMNFLLFDKENSYISSFSDKVLVVDDNSNNQDTMNNYLNFDYIDNQMMRINIKIDEMSLDDVNVTGLNFNFNSNKSNVQGELIFDITDPKYNGKVSLRNLSLQKVDNVHLILGEFSNQGSNVNEALRILDAQDHINIQGKNNLSYSIKSKILFSPKEISIFDAVGKIGNQGEFSGSVVANKITNNGVDTDNYAFNLKFAHFELDNFFFPLLKERASTLLTKSNDDDYITYFRWFRMLSSIYNIKFEFSDTKLKNENIDNLLISGTMYPGDMSLKGNLKSTFFDGEYKLDLQAKSIKPTATLVVNSKNIDFEKLADLLNHLIIKEDNTQSNNINWINRKFNLFKIYKYGAKFDISSQSLNLYNQNIDNFRLIGHTSSDILYIDNLYLGIYGGKIQVKGNMSFFEPSLYQFSFNSSGMEISKVIKSAFPSLNGNIDGPIAISGSAVTQGDTWRQLANNFTLSSSFAASGINVNGLDGDVIVDIALKRKPLEKDQVLTALDEALNNGVTNISNVYGSIKANKGIINIDNMTFKTRFSSGSFAMSLDLAQLTFSSVARFAFPSYFGQELISYTINKSGSILSDINKKIDKDVLLKYVKTYYGIITAEDIAAAKAIQKKQQTVLSDDDPDTRNYLYSKLLKQFNDEKEKAQGKSLGQKNNQ